MKWSRQVQSDSQSACLLAGRTVCGAEVALGCGPECERQPVTMTTTRAKAVAATTTTTTKSVECFILDSYYSVPTVCFSRRERHFAHRSGL